MPLAPPPPVDPLMEADEIQLWILRKLGAPIVEVALAACHLEDAVSDAKRWMAAKKGFTRRDHLFTVAGQSIYKLGPDVDTVTDVAFESTALDLAFTGMSGGGFFLPEQMAQIPYQALAAPQSGGLYSSLTQVIQAIEMDKRALSLDEDWDWISSTKELILTPTPRGAKKVIYIYKSRSFNITDLNEREHLLLRRYALAQAKMTLGGIYGKYDGFPTAQGTASLNGNALKEEAQAELDKLDTEMLNETTPLLITTG